MKTPKDIILIYTKRILALETLLFIKLFPSISEASYQYGEFHNRWIQRVVAALVKGCQVDCEDFMHSFEKKIVKEYFMHQKQRRWWKTSTNPRQIYLADPYVCHINKSMLHN